MRTCAGSRLRLLAAIVVAICLSASVFAAGKPKKPSKPKKSSPGRDKHLVDNDLVLENLTDQPDPLSTEVAGSSTITSQYSAKEHPEAPQRGGAQQVHEPLISQQIVVSAPDGTPARTLTTEVQVPQPPDKKGKPGRIDVQIQVHWDGRDDSGAALPDGRYTYEVRAKYFWRMQTPAETVEHLLGRISPAAGSITLDNTKPQIAQLKPVDGLQTKDPSPEISALLSDNLSGVDPTSIELVLDGSKLDHSYDVSSGELTYQHADDLAEGHHSLKLSIRDFAGNPREARSHFVTDYSPPVTVDNYERDSQWTNQDADITLTAVDNLTGVAHTYFKIDDAKKQEGTKVQISEEGSHAVKY
ncbi:MAG: hypothetical protein ACLFWL_17305, partial [Candidatus Brocadiia bacterium]